jgi:hypothetical protein
MSNYHKDDGSQIGGIITIVCIASAFSAGYWVREQGVRFSVDVPRVERRVNK